MDRTGLYNSSITRVRPVFGKLLHRDPTGVSWLSPLLALLSSRADMKNNPGMILPEISSIRLFSDRILTHYGVKPIPLENCFEKRLPPADRFLRWLIAHPDQMTWPRQGRQRYSSRTQCKREALFGFHGPREQAAVQREALDELNRKGAGRSARKWWSFEGFTEVDCYLETENLILLIEGKRTEPLGKVVSWYTQRSQLVRSLEVAQEIARAVGKSFAVLVVAEEPQDPLSPNLVAGSLPHFSPTEREDLMEHYWGVIRWRDLCNTTGVDYAALPDTVHDWIEGRTAHE